MVHGCGLPRIYRGMRRADGTAFVAVYNCGDSDRLCFTCFGKLMTDLRDDARLGARPSQRKPRKPRPLKD